MLTLRAAQDLRDFRKDSYHQHTADVTWDLVRNGDDWRIQRKVVRLINSTTPSRPSLCAVGSGPT